MRAFRRTFLVALTGALLACRGEPPQPPPSPPLVRSVTASPGDTTIGAANGEWRMAAGDPANTRYSSLTGITPENVGRLDTVFTFRTGIARGHEAAPLIVNATMYLVAPFPNTVYALDLTKPGAPVKWVFEPRPLPAAQGVACCDVVNRGAVYVDGRIIFNTLDNQTIALDANTGAELWRTQLGDINRGETMTMAPLAAEGLVFVGNSGGEMGVRGKITALDAATGAVRWEATHTGPDRDMLIGPSFRPFYPADRQPGLGISTWPPDAWRQGGGTVWGWVSYDPALHLIYYGSGNPGPWNPEQRPGDNKWTSSVFARDAATGEARWAYQWSPHDLFDHDGVNENILVDLEWRGRPRQLLLHAERNGYVYVMDRSTGEVLAAQPFVHITSSHGVDLATGRLIPEPSKTPVMGKVVREICPAAPGAKDWQPAAWSPRTRLLYIPHNNLCMDWESVEANYIAGTPYVGANVRYYAGPGGNQGVFTAWDPIAGRKVWSIPERFPAWSGALVTAGDIVFYGTMDGWFKAVDAQSGTVLWKRKLVSGVIGQPVTYRGPDGRQYVAVFSGVGGWPGAVVTGDLDTRDSTAATGWGGAMRDLKRATDTGSTLYVFAVPS